MRRGQWAARAAVVVAALVAVLAATSGPVQAQEADTVLIGVVTIDPDGYCDPPQPGWTAWRTTNTSPLSASASTPGSARSTAVER